MSAPETTDDAAAPPLADHLAANPDASPADRLSPPDSAGTESPADAPRRYSQKWAIAVAVGLLALLPLAYLGLRQIRLKNDVASWLPAGDPNKIALDWFHEHFEPHDRMLATWTSSSLDDPRVEAFAKAVTQQPLAGTDPPIVAIESAVTPGELIDRMVGNRIDEAVATKRLEGVLVGTGLLKVRLTPTGRERRDALVADLRSQAADTFEFPVRIESVGDNFARPQRTVDDFDAAADEDEGGKGGKEPELPEPVSPEAVSPEPVVSYDFELGWPGIQPGSVRTDRIRRWLDTLGEGRTDERVPLIEEVFFEPGSPVAVSVTVNENFEGRTRATLDAVREAAVVAGIDLDELRMGGSPVAAATLNDNVLKAANNGDVPVWRLPRRSPVGFSLLVGVVLAFVVLRSVRLAVLVLLVSIYTTVVTLALVPPTGGSMSMVLVVMPSLLLVLTMSGAIHVANYWKHAAGELHERHGDAVPKGAAVLQAARQAAVPCAMASLTTSIGLLALMTSPLTPVRDFGLYSAIGCVISLFMVLVAFPALLRLWPGRVTPKADHGRGGAIWAGIGRWINRYSTLVATVCLVGMLAGAAGLHRFRTETKVIRYFPDDSRIVQDYEYLEENLAGIVPVTVIVGFQGDGWGNGDLHDQLDLVRTLETRLADMPDISGTLALPDFLPEDDPELSRFKRSRIKRSIFDGVRDAVESPEAGGSEFVTRVKIPLTVGNDGRPVDFAPTPPPDDPDDRQPLGQEIYKITAQVSILTDLDYGPFLADVDAVIQATIAEWQAEQDAAADDGYEDTEADTEEDAEADAEPAPERRVEYLVTGTVPLFLRTQEAVLESLIRSFGLAFLIIAVVMMVILKSPVAGLITMIPNLLPVGLVFGLVSWAEVPVDIGTMITASVALGVAVDGTLHLLTWFRQRLGQGESAGEAIGAGLSHCGPAMFQTSMVVALGLLCLMFSDLLLISRFGWLMAALITAALVADLIFLPSLLGGRLGRVIERSVSSVSDAGLATRAPARTE